MGFIEKLKRLRAAIILIFLLCSTADAAYTSELDKPDKLDNIPVARMKMGFLKLYSEQWKLFGTEALLDKIIDEAIEEQTADLMWGTAWYQLAANRDGIIEKIQEAIIFKFVPGYENFLDQFRELFGDMLRKEILNFYEEQSERFFVIEQNPMVQAHIRQDYDSVVSTQGLKLTNEISVKLSERHNITLTGTKLGAGLFLKFGIRALGKQLAKKAGGALLTKIGGSAVGTAFQAVSGPIGWAMLAWTAYDVMDMVFSSKEEVRKHLHEMNQNSFTSKIPLEQWDAMEPYVRDSFVFAYERLQNKVKRALEIQNDIVIKQLYSSMNEVQTNFFSTRVAVLDSALEDYTGSKENLFKYFGETIRDVSIKNFETFILMLREGDWENLSEWIDLDGVEKCCKRYNKTSKKFWTELPPD